MKEYIVSAIALGWLEEDSETFLSEYADGGPRIYLGDFDDELGTSEYELVEIVRCRDCKYYPFRDPYEPEKEKYCCEYATKDVFHLKKGIADGDGFCSWGERNANGN